MIPKHKDRSEQTTKKHKSFLLKNSNFDGILIGTSMLERFLYDQGAMVSYEKNGLSKFNLFNCGVGGDKICNILYRLKTLGILNDVQGDPKCVILECGANDVESKSIKINELCQGVKQLLEIIRQSFKCPIYLVGVFPRKSKFVDDEEMVSRIRRMNQALKGLYPENEVIVCDWSGDYLDGDRIRSEYFVDDVHFNEKGYDIFAKHLVDVLSTVK